MEMGKPRMQAALDGSKEIAFTIVSMTVSLAAVFIPILFMGGIVGRLMHEFAVTIAAAILVSGLVSLTLTPMLCSRFLKPPHSMKHGRALQRHRSGCSTAGCGSTRWTLKGTIRFKGATMVVSALLLVGTVYLFRIVPTGFIPSVDTGQLNGQIEAMQGIGFEAMVAHQKEVMDDPREGPERRGVHVQRRRLGRRPPERRPEAARRADARRPTRSSRSCGRSWPASRAFASSCRTRRRSASAACMSRGAVPVRAAGSRHRGALSRRAGLRGGAAQCARAARRQLGPADQNPQLSVDLDREQIAALGLTVDQVESALSSAYGSRQVSQIFAPDDEYQVIMQVAPEFQQDPAALSMLYVQAPGGKLVPLSARGHDAAERRAAVDQPHRPAAVGHAVVQPRARRRARRRGRARRAAGARDAARRRYRAASRARRRRSRIRCAGSAGFSRSRSSSSTSCSASSTRASSTRSRFSRACRRPASARC